MDYTKEIELVTQIAGSSASAILEQYTKYYIVSSAWWALVWGAAIGSLVVIVRKCMKPDGSADGLVLSLLGIALLTASLAFAYNIDHLMNPRAIAIHRLLSDIRGNN